MASKNIPAIRPALKVAEDYPAVASYIDREFKRQFPTLELLDFNAGHHHWVSLAGTEAELLRLKIVDPSLIAVRPKRLAYSPGAKVWTRRRARDLVEAHIDLDESLDRSHPLANFAVWNWEEILKQSTPLPNYSTPREWKSKYKRSLAIAFPIAELFQYSKPGEDDLRDQIYGIRFRFGDRDIQRFTSIIAKFREELFTAIDQAAAIDTQQPTRPSFLRLAVDNER